MPTMFEALTSRSRPLEAANEEFAATHAAGAQGSRSRGWDPYEVWRVLIKEPQERFGPKPRRPQRPVIRR